MQIAVVLMAYGGPGSLDEVEPFLRHVLSRENLPPGIIQSSKKRYAQIGSKSPLLEISQRQAAALETFLNQHSHSQEMSFRVYTGMKHWHPFIHETVDRVLEDEFDRLVGLCLAPQYSNFAIGGYFRLLQEALQSSTAGAARLEDGSVLQIESWHTQPALVQAWVQNIQSSLETLTEAQRGETALLFTAHSLPERLMPAGDPYPQQIQETASAVTYAMGWPAEHAGVTYQCVGHGGGTWLGPYLDDEVAECAAVGYKNLVVVPAGFVSDHVETLYDLDIKLREQVESLGINLVRVPSLNDAPLLIEALANLVLGKVINA